jgi:GntR family transcriptional regulator
MLVKDPIYHQLRQLLHDSIRKGDFATGDKFLTERDVAEKFGVSRTTANKALSSLVADGTLEFRKGVGSFVRPAILDYELRALVSFSDKATASGRIPKTEIIAFRCIQAADAPGHVVSQLANAPSDPLFFVERLRYADGAPVILERRYIVARLCPQLTREELEGSLYAAWTNKHGLVITGADQTIRAVILSEQDAQVLQLKQGDAALAVLALGCVEGGKPLWWEETLYRADAYEFHCRLGGLHPPHPPTGHLLAKSES